LSAIFVKIQIKVLSLLIEKAENLKSRQNINIYTIMYTLTEVSKNITFHQKLGDRFSVIDRESSLDEFVRAYNATNKYKLLENEDINENIYSLIITEGGTDVIKLDKNNNYYVVTENGKTFKNLTFK